jgi:hypothetical protein
MDSWERHPNLNSFNIATNSRLISDFAKKKLKTKYLGLVA